MRTGLTLEVGDTISVTGEIVTKLTYDEYNVFATLDGDRIKAFCLDQTIYLRSVN